MTGSTSQGDLYQILGIRSSASPEEIRAAYHQAARRFHPDSNPNPGAADEFKLVADAYAVLNDSTRRAAYDQSQPANGRRSLVEVETLYSRQPLPALDEPQVLYVLLEIRPAILDTLPVPPLNVCLVIDRSTSMQGARLDEVKAAVLQLIDGLREEDVLSVVAFSDRAEVVVAGQRGQAERAFARARVSSLGAHGGTEILQGFLTGLIELHRHLNLAAANHLVLLTDGRTYGDEADCLMLASLAATDGITVSSLGIGEEWNDRFLDELTSRTGGTTAYIQAAQNVGQHIHERIRGLSQAYAERLALHVTLDPGVELLTAFKVQPEPGAVALEQPLRLGSLPRPHARVLLKFRLPPLTAGNRYVARLTVQADVVSLGRRGERRIVDLAVPVVKDPPPGMPPPMLIEALGKLSQYQMQERVWQEVAAGDVAAAAERLKALGTRLLAGGQPELARLALSQAANLESTRVLAEDVKKQLKYGTRALIAAPGVTGGVR